MRAMHPHGPAASPPSPFQRLLTRIRAEYHEMPGLRLTLPQARRLWDLDLGTCAAALSALRSSGFLAKTRDGAFVLSEGRSTA